MLLLKTKCSVHDLHTVSYVYIVTLGFRAGLCVLSISIGTVVNCALVKIGLPILAQVQVPDSKHFWFSEKPKVGTQGRKD